MQENCENLSQAGVAMTKFDNLNRRFVTPSSIVVGNDKRFPGVQEFFIEFLRFSENVSFLSHVRDVLVQRIISLNGSNFSSDISGKVNILYNLHFDTLTMSHCVKITYI